MTQYDVIIAGAGFAGIYAAWKLSKYGKKIALVEASDYIGGNLKSREWNGFWLDNGTHNFDLRTPVGEQFFLDILKDNILVFEDQQWATTTNKSWTSGFELPDYGTDDPEFSRLILEELMTIKENQNITFKKKPDSFLDYFENKFGPKLTKRLIPAIKKYTGSHPAEFSVESSGSLGMFSRVKLGSDSEMIKMKEKDPFWDDRLGVSLQSLDKRFMGRNINKRFCYPAKMGLNGFCISAHERLLELGVHIYLSDAICGLTEENNRLIVKTKSKTFSSNYLFWSLPEIILAKIIGSKVELADSAIPVGTCFFAFEVDENDILGPDYLHDYSEERLPFRYNKQGIYSNQIKADGSTLVVFEMPCHPKDIAKNISENNLKKAWSAAIDVGFLKPTAKYKASTSIGHPVAYTLPKIGWKRNYETVQNDIQRISKNIIGIDFGYRGRLKFMNLFEDKLQFKFLDP